VNIVLLSRLNKKSARRKKKNIHEERVSNLLAWDGMRGQVSIMAKRRRGAHAIAEFLKLVGAGGQTTSRGLKAEMERGAGGDGKQVLM